MKMSSNNFIFITSSINVLCIFFTCIIALSSGFNPFFDLPTAGEEIYSKSIIPNLDDIIFFLILIQFILLPILIIYQILKFINSFFSEKRKKDVKPVVFYLINLILIYLIGRWSIYWIME